MALGFFHDSVHENFSLLGFEAVQSGRRLPTFPSNTLSSAPG
jgi:hypothetical protein